MYNIFINNEGENIKEKRNNKKEKFSRNFIKKLFIIFMLIIFYMSPYKFDKNLITSDISP